MDISEVARRSGLPASALRFYEEKGLISSVGREGLRRQFKPDVLDRLALIALGRVAGFSLDEIGAMFAHGPKAGIDRNMLSAKADEIDATIKRLKATRNGLRHAAVCSAPSQSECPTFQKLLRAAACGMLDAGAARKKPGAKTAGGKR